MTAITYQTMMIFMKQKIFISLLATVALIVGCSEGENSSPENTQRTAGQSVTNPADGSKPNRDTKPNTVLKPNTEQKPSTELKPNAALPADNKPQADKAKVEEPKTDDPHAKPQPDTDPLVDDKPQADKAKVDEPKADDLHADPQPDTDPPADDKPQADNSDEPKAGDPQVKNVGTVEKPELTFEEANAAFLKAKEAVDEIKSQIMKLREFETELTRAAQKRDLKKVADDVADFLGDAQKKAAIEVAATPAKTPQVIHAAIKTMFQAISTQAGQEEKRLMDERKVLEQNKPKSYLTEINKQKEVVEGNEKILNSMIQALNKHTQLIFDNAYSPLRGDLVNKNLMSHGLTSIKEELRSIGVDQEIVDVNVSPDAVKDGDIIIAFKKFKDATYVPDVPFFTASDPNSSEKVFDGLFNTFKNLVINTAKRILTAKNKPEVDKLAELRVKQEGREIKTALSENNSQIGNAGRRKLEADAAMQDLDRIDAANLNALQNFAQQLVKDKKIEQNEYNAFFVQDITGAVEALKKIVADEISERAALIEENKGPLWKKMDDADQAVQIASDNKDY